LIVSLLEKEMGIDVYAFKSPGIGGIIRSSPEDFVVQEILVDGSKAHAKSEENSIPQGRGRYLVCVLVKRRWDTLLAVKAVTKQLGLEQERISFAGMKDANALTAQYISISRITPKQVLPIKIKGITLYPLKFSNEKITSLLLAGNAFKIVIKEIALSLAEIEERIGKISRELEHFGGVPNYFGHQRFGTRRAITHLVGKHIVKGDWEAAALTFLAKPSEFEHPDSKLARDELWKTRDFTQAFSSFPFQLKHEKAMLAHLCKHQEDYIGAFHRLPKRLCQLFVNAYQSFLFNKFVSERIKQGMPLNSIQKGEYTLQVEKQDCLALPIIGYKQPLSHGSQGEIEEKILEEENITPEQFQVSAMLGISAGGGLRRALLSIEDFTVAKPTRDSVNPARQQVELGFMLNKGSYATVVLREFMKPENLITSGF
jgi:tRNA pseudouridine13 synthase